MGLVDYSDSESESESVQQKPTASKKTFQKLLDRSSGAGKIVVNLPAASATADASAEHDAEQPPAKRAKIAGGSRFSSLGAFLPPPKKTASTPAGGAGKPSVAPAPGVHLRTAAEPAFIRGNSDGDVDTATDASSSVTSGLSLPAPTPTSAKGPSIPEGQKPAEEVKLVGKPLMFKPLSVARKKAPAKNKKKDELLPGPSGAAPNVAALAKPTSSGAGPTATGAEQPKKKKISLFSMDDDEPTSSTTTTAAPLDTYSYEPPFTGPGDNLQDQQQEQDDSSAITSTYPTCPPPQPTQPPPSDTDPLAALASTLSPAAQRELFGRHRHPPATTNNASSSNTASSSSARVVTFDMAREYAHNEQVRASASQQQQAHNPVRAIAPGKHSLRQVVTMAQSNRSALEESFARAKGTKREAAGRYGWK